MNKLKVIYVAGPYRDPRGEYWVNENIRKAAQCGLAVWKLGGVALVPHLNTFNFGGALYPKSEGVWITGDLELLSRCDAIWMIEGWEYSTGAVREKAHAEKRGIPILYSVEEVEKFLEE